MRCKKCASLLNDGDTVCPVCGTAVSEEPDRSQTNCSKCGAALKPGAKFCPQCGQKTAPAPEAKTENAGVDEGQKTPFISLSKDPEGTQSKPEPKAESAAAVCVKCGTELKPGAKFCPKCGTKTEAAASVPAAAPAPKGVFCPKCGTEMKPDAKFCPKCGNNMQAAAPVVPAPAPAVPAPKPISGDTKVCPKCHGVMKPGSKVCAVCGYKLGDPVKPNPDDTAPLPEVKDSMSAAAPSPAPAPAPAPAAPVPAAPAVPKKPISPLPFILIGVVLVVIVGIIILVNVISSVMNQPQTINLDEYLSVEYEGYTGFGTATVSFDEDKFSSDWKSKLSYKKEARTFKHAGEIESGDPTTLISYYAKKSLKLDKTEELSNGDVVKVKWKISDTAKKDILEFLNCEVNASNPEFTVEGLKEIEAVDLFKDIEVEFEGTSPRGYAYVHNNSSYSFRYTLDKDNNLSNGDKVVVTLSDYYGDDLEEEMVKEYHKKPASLTKEYVVSGLKEVVSKLDQISDTILTDVKNEVEEFVDNETSKTGVTQKSKEYMGLILAVKSEYTSYDYSRLYAVYKVTVSLKDDASKKPVDYTFYTTEYFRDLTLNSDGSVDSSSFSSSYNYFDSVRPSTKNYYSFYGYESYDKLYESVTSGTGYSYESNISTETPAPVEESTPAEESSKTSDSESKTSGTESEASEGSESGTSEEGSESSETTSEEEVSEEG